MPLPDIPPGLEVRCNSLLESIKAQLLTYQPTFLSQNKKYWQGIITPFPSPADGNEKVPSKAVHPTDQAKDWSDITLPVMMVCSSEAHVHQGPDGWGYTLYGQIEIAGRTWRRAIGVGPHSQTFDWVDVTPRIV